jgi:hypothetical protein
MFVLLTFNWIFLSAVLAIGYDESVITRLCCYFIYLPVEVAEHLFIIILFTQFEIKFRERFPFINNQIPTLLKEKSN